jgi:rubrerythrin
MVTTVGTESSFTDLVTSLVQLEHDAIAAYDACIDRLEDPAAKSQIESFKQDHLRHLDELQKIASVGNFSVPTGGDLKQMLTTGKVAMASLMGDGAILKAMKTNEDDTVAAYERASTHAEARPESREVFERAHQDELRHRSWMESRAQAA